MGGVYGFTPKKDDKNLHAPPAWVVAERAEIESS